MRKLMLTLTTIAILVLVPSSFAFAISGNSGYTTPTAGVSPHGGYQTTTNKCSVCHAVHGADASGELLLRSTREDACSYCHIDPGISGLIVYAGDTTKYTGSDLPNGHNNWGVGNGVMCTSCHQVHGATDMMTQNAYLSSKILVKRDFYNIAADPDPDTGTGEPLPGDSDKLALSKWCAELSGCHGGVLYWPNAGMGESHPIGETGTANANGTSSFGAGSQYCTSCHSDSKVASVETTGAFPHYTDGVRFLQASGSDLGGAAGSVSATNSAQDGICLRCHRNGAGIGVGQTF